MTLAISGPLILRRPLLKVEEVFANSARLNLLDIPPAEALPFAVFDMFRQLYRVPRWNDEVFQNAVRLNLVAIPLIPALVLVVHRALTIVVLSHAEVVMATVRHAALTMVVVSERDLTKLTVRHFATTIVSVTHAETV